MCDRIAAPAEQKRLLPLRMQRSACVISRLLCNRVVVHSAVGLACRSALFGIYLTPSEGGLSGWGVGPRAAQEVDKRIFLPQMAAFST